MIRSTLWIALAIAFPVLAAANTSKQPLQLASSVSGIGNRNAPTQTPQQNNAEVQKKGAQQGIQKKNKSDASIKLKQKKSVNDGKTKNLQNSQTPGVGTMQSR